ncbi:MAG: hypothetical protein K0V04_22865 [Deltaproteobacteria bacterium]|nr:hypothetical protein [Deltaproteobacteria bacterium]
MDSSGSTSSEGTADTGPATSGSSSGGVSELGCADGVRDALTDTQTYPDIAACAGGFWVPGLHLDLPTCDRNGGNDGPLADGMGCSIDDLCAAGWHVCASQSEVEAAGVVDCDALPWGQQFFATAQSGNGKDSCAATGTNDVFGCGDVGYSEIFSCAPLNRSAGNNCVNLPGAWECDGHPFDELQHITKTGSDFGGALCCRDGA